MLTRARRLPPDPSSPSPDRPPFDRLAPLLAVVIAIVAGVHAIDAAIVGVFYDDAHYVILAKSLATGSGYRYINLPGAPEATHFPPGYPALLALLWRVSPEFPGNIALFRMVNALLLGLIAALVFQVGRRRLGYGAPGAAFAAIASTATIPALLLSANVISETLFLAMLIPFLAACETRHREPSWRMALWLGAGAGVLTLVRSHGIVLVPTLVVLYLARRRWRDALVSLGAGVVTLLPWLIWVARHDGALHPEIRGQYGSYSAWFVEGLVAHGPSLVIATVHQNLVTTYAVIARSFAIASHPALNALAVVSVLVLVAGGVMDFARRWRAALWFLAFYVTIVIVWPFSPLRFVWGVWPLIVLLGVSGAHFWWRGEDGGDRPRVARIRRGLVTTAAALCLAGAVSFNVRGYANAWWATASQSLGPRIQPQLAWVAGHTDSTDVVATSDDGAVYLYTGRRAVPVTGFTAGQYVTDRTPAENAASLASIISEYSPHYVLAWAIPTQQAAAMLAGRPRPALVKLDSLPGGQVFRVTGSAEPR